MPDHCTVCKGVGGHSIVLGQADDFCVSRGWANCEACNSTGLGSEQRRIEHERCAELEGVFGD